MRKPKAIIAMSPTDALEAHSLAVGGDSDATADYVRWCVWRGISKINGLSAIGKLKAFLSFYKNVELKRSNG